MHVGRFLCPPPVLFFEEGDIQLDIDWKNVARGCCFANSSIIARRHTSNVTKSRHDILSDEMKFKTEMDSVQLEIDKLERKKDMIGLAYKCAEKLREDSNHDDPAIVEFRASDEKVKQCIYNVHVLSLWSAYPGCPFSANIGTVNKWEVGHRS